MEEMKMKAYANYGVIAHECETVYTVDGHVSDIYDEIEINVPGETYENEAGETLYDTGDGVYRLNEILKTVGGGPALRWFNGQHFVTKKCEVIG